MRLLILLAVLLASPGSAADYVISTQGTAAGTMSVTGDDRRRTIAHETGGPRGVKSRSIVEIDASGMISRVDYTGTSQLMGEQFERFEIKPEGATWETGIDKGSSRSGGFYNALSANAEHMAILARALLAAPGGRLPLLPSGEASIAVGDRIDLSTETGPIPLTLYLISGLSKRPVAVWLDGSLQLAARVASVEPSTVRRDLASGSRRLLEVQEARLTLLDQELARRAVERPAGPILIRNANLFDAVSARMRPGTSVLIEGNRIAAVAPDARLEVPPGARIIEAGGRALLPGLWDAHVHMFDTSEAVMTLANGITSVRDMGNDGTLTAAWRQRFDAGELVGPRLFTGAVVDGPGERSISWAHSVEDAGELHALVDRLAAEGYGTVKLFNGLPRDLALRLIERAHARGLVAGGHLPRGMRLQELIDAGIDESTHLDFFGMQFVGPYGPDDTSGSGRIALLADRGDRLLPASPDVSRMLRAMRRRGVSLDPTVTGLELLMRDAPDRPASFIAPLADRLPGTYSRGMVGMAPADPAGRAKTSLALERLLALLGRAARAGVPIVAGGDGEPGVMIPRELELYVEAGMTPLQALQTATINPARRLGMAKDLGSIEPGKLADLVLVDGDVARDVGAVREVVLVVKDGALLDVARLNAHVGMRPSGRVAAFSSR